jgi:hypothetical protein
MLTLLNVSGAKFINFFRFIKLFHRLACVVVSVSLMVVLASTSVEHTL